ncbi:sulfurtransferase complex subunit TusB [Vibrio sp. S9_S30]|uniref:sulfurtransferase complex subunit TusB n=1 Tax=Vibrio sp. S9_S30 TaxID=2720226 RepID=UPI001681BFCD|nr:sulfurtransferase complex subunit TusB [Vibrio sp. S9_S30]MBD1557352.1 sulfurtransferase complex subunit TusB [Vibrio sp. S9_S30]
MLHIVKSLTGIQEAIQYATSQDTILLVEDAVYAAITHHQGFESLLNSQLGIYVLMPDVVARGLSGCIDTAVAKASFNDWVTLTETHESNVTWE